MVQVPAMSPFDNFAAPPVVDMGESLAYSAKKDSSTAANQGVNKVPSSFAKSEKNAPADDDD